MEVIGFFIPELFVSWSEIGSFLGGDIASNFFFSLFFGMRFSRVTLALASPVNTELIDRSVRIFPPILLLVMVLMIK